MELNDSEEEEQKNQPKSSNLVRRFTQRSKETISSPLIDEARHVNKSVEQQAQQAKIDRAKKLAGVGKTKPDMSLRFESWMPGNMSGFVLHPNGRLQDWAVLTMVALIWAAIVTPYEIAFLQHGRLGDTSTWSVVFVISTIVDLVFWLDLIVSFHTAYIDEMTGVWVTNKNLIASNYLQGWFTIDLISVLPFGVISDSLSRDGGSGADLKVLKLVRLLRLLKLLRVSKLNRIGRRLAYLLSHKFRTVARFISVIIIFMHWSSCLLRIVADHEVYATEDSWLQSNGYIPICEKYRLYGIDLEDNLHDAEERMCNAMYQERNFKLYIATLSWSLSAMNGGFDHSILIGELLLNVLVSLLGCIIMAFMIGEIANALANLDPAGNEYKMKIDNLNDYMTMKKFPKEFKNKLREYFENSDCLFRFNFNRSLLSHLSPTLQRIVANKDVGAWIKQIPILATGVRLACHFFIGTHVLVSKARSDDKSNKLKDEPQEPVRTPACIVKFEPFLNYTVEYDDATREMVPHEDLSLDKHIIHSTVVSAVGQELSGLISELALALCPQLYLAGEYVSSEFGINDTMYIFVQGSAWMYRQRRRSYGKPETRTRPPPMLLSDQTHSVLGYDIAHQLVGSAHKRRYVAVAIGHTLCNTLHATVFRSIISCGRYMHICASLRKIAGWGMLRHRFQQIGELAIMESERRAYCAELSTRITKVVRMYVAIKRYHRNLGVSAERRKSCSKIAQDETPRENDRVTLCVSRSLKTLLVGSDPKVNFPPIWVQHLWKIESEQFLKKMPHYRYLLLSPNMDHTGGIYFSNSPVEEKAARLAVGEQEQEDAEVGACRENVSLESVTTTELDSAPPQCDSDIFLQPGHSVSMMLRRILDNQLTMERDMTHRLKIVESEVAKMNMSIAVESSNQRLLHEAQTYDL